MNRRNYLKSILALAGIAITSLSVTKWLNINYLIDEKELWGKRTIIAELAEMIIPASDTPGAKMASVDHYIIKVLLNCRNTRQQHKFLSGIDEIERFTKSTFGLEFLDCGEPNRHKVLQHFYEKGSNSHGFLSKIQERFLGKPFFSELRQLTVEGYCQSKLGATNGLAYDYIPRVYEPCTFLNPHQKSWATK